MKVHGYRIYGRQGSNQSQTMASTDKKQPKQTASPQRQSRTKSSINIDPSQTSGLTVVGIGASAGGLKALQAFFQALPNDTNMAYVVITHMHPEHESHLPDILQLRTSMPVTQVTSLVAVESNHVYVIPPNRRIVMEDSKLDVTEFQ